MDGNNENIYGIDGNSAFMKKNTMEEMRRCLIYMSRLWGADKGLLMGHVMCGLSIRKPYLQIVSGVPACIVLFISVMLDLFDVSQTIVSKIANIRGNLVEACLCIIMLIVDIIVWLRERRLFVGNKGYRDYKIREEISKC